MPTKKLKSKGKLSLPPVPKTVVVKTPSKKPAAPKPKPKPPAKRPLPKPAPKPKAKPAAKKPLRDFGHPVTEIPAETPRPDQRPTAPAYRHDSPKTGFGGDREIYRFGDKGLVADFIHPGNLSQVEVTPVNFVGSDVTSFVFAGPPEMLNGPADLQRKLKEFA